MSKLSPLTSHLSLPTSHFPSLTSHLSSLSSHLSAPISQLPSLNSHLLPLTSHLSSLTSQLSLLISHLSPLTSHLSSLTSHLSPLNSQLPSLNSQLSPLTSHLSAFPFLLRLRVSACHFFTASLLLQMQMHCYPLSPGLLHPRHHLRSGLLRYIPFRKTTRRSRSSADQLHQHSRPCSHRR